MHGIVSQSGGHVAVYSELGLGATFKVYLPAAAGPAVNPAFSQEQPPERLSGTETILLCEDDELVRVLFETILVENGYRVLPASRPDEALELASSCSGPLDALVSDVVMPQLSGPELAERIRATRPEVKVLLLSGYPADTVRRHGLPDRSVFLQKPFDDLSLLRALRTLFDADPELEGAESVNPAVGEVAEPTD